MAITLLTKKWADAHGLPVREKVAGYISGANRTVVKNCRYDQHDSLAGAHLWRLMCQMSLFAWAISTKGLLRCNLLCRHNEVLGAATISLPGPD